jgi:RNA polymerase-binding transcription factor DksA
VSRDKNTKSVHKNTQGNQMKRKTDELRSKTDYPHPRKANSHANRSDMNRGTYKYCSLCGKQNHIAAQGCYNMVDDNGKRVSVLPTHSTCTECPERVVPRLNHPVQLCPLRRLGPFSHLS